MGLEVNTGFVMGAGTATRTRPLTWDDTKMNLPVVGESVITRINVELLEANDISEQTITTWYKEQQVLRHIGLMGETHPSIHLSNYSLGTASDDLIGNAGGVYKAYRDKYFPGRSIRAMTGFRDTNLRELSRWWLDHPKGDAPADLFDPAVDEIRGLNPIPDMSKLPLFTVVGCDCLAAINMRRSAQEFIALRGARGTLGHLTLAPFNDFNSIQNYGLVIVDGDFIKRFIEKPINSKKEKGDDYEDWVNSLKSTLTGSLGEAWLVNEQVYMFDPAVLAVIETHMDVAGSRKLDSFPDMSMHLLKLLAAAGHLGYRVMDRGAHREYWSDIGDILTYLESVVEHVLARGYGNFSIPHTSKSEAPGSMIYIGAVGSMSPAVKVERHAFINGNVVGRSFLKNTVLEAGSRVEDSTLNGTLLLPDSRVYPGWTLDGCIVGRGVQLLSPDHYGIEHIRNTILVRGYGDTVLATRIPGTKQGEDRNKMPDIPGPLGHR